MTNCSYLLVTNEAGITKKTTFKITVSLTSLRIKGTNTPILKIKLSKAANYRGKPIEKR